MNKKYPDKKYPETAQEYDEAVDKLYDGLTDFRTMFTVLMRKHGYTVRPIIREAWPMPRMIARKKGGLDVTLVQFLDPFGGAALAVQGQSSMADTSSVFYFNMLDCLVDRKRGIARFERLLQAVEEYLEREIIKEDRREF